MRRSIRPFALLTIISLFTAVGTTVIQLGFGWASSANATQVVAGSNTDSVPQVTPWNGATDRSSSGATCNDYMFDVAQHPGEPKEQRIFGRLCHKGPVDGKTLQVLLHGGSYDHKYWDFPYEPNKYSYVKSATDDGYATLSLDRLGYGYSSHSDPFTASFDVQGYVVHQVIQQVRAGKLGKPFSKVALVGHSMGSFTSWYEAGKYHDVDSVIITGAQHHGTAKLFTQVVASILEPAQLDPKFQSKNLPLGYTTTFPGGRCDLFYDKSNVDPKVCDLDEKLKSTINMGENTSFTPSMILDSALSRSINVPVLMVDGQHDDFYCDGDCNARAKAEGYNYANSPCYDPYIVPRAGHDINLQRNADSWFRKAGDWLDKRIGPSQREPATKPCG